MTIPPLPSPEQWTAIQGGEPLILGNEEATLFHIAHVYNDLDNIKSFNESETYKEKYPHYGLLIDTPVTQLNRSLREASSFMIGANYESVTIPWFMMIETHGNPCLKRSGGGRDAYNEIHNRQQWSQYLELQAADKWDVWKLIIDERRNKPKITEPVLLRDILKKS